MDMGDKDASQACIQIVKLLGALPLVRTLCLCVQQQRDSGTHVICVLLLPLSIEAKMKSPLLPLPPSLSSHPLPLLAYLSHPNHPHHVCPS